MDFITDLPLCEGYDAIMVVVNQFMKMAHFIPCRDLPTLEQTARLYINRVMNLHSVPEQIISDRGGQFAAEFWSKFWLLLKVKTSMSTAYHPETDSQTKRVNSVINQYVRIFCTYLQDNWVNLLGPCKFAYNNSIHRSTDILPFFANYGLNPKSHPHNVSRLTSDQADILAALLRKVDKFLKSNLETACEDMKIHADIHQKESPVYKPGNLVLLLSKNLSTTRPKPKWNHKNVSPYKVVGEAYPGLQAYKLELPESMSLIHPVFHMSLLTPYIKNKFDGRVEPPPPPVILDDTVEYEVECIVDSHIRDKKREYKVPWTGYDSSEDLWIPESEADHISEHVADWNKAHPNGKCKRRRQK